MKIINGYVTESIDKRHIKDTLLYVRKFSDSPIFSGDSDLHEIEKKLLRFCILVLHYNAFGGSPDQILWNAIDTYHKNREKILHLVQKYHFSELFMLADLWCRFERFFYDDLYDLYLYHFDHFRLKSAYSGNVIIKGIPLWIRIYRGLEDWHDSNNSLFFELLDHDVKIFWFALYFGEDSIFISNLQYTKDYYAKFGGLKKLRLHKYAFYFLKKLSEKFGKPNIFAYSNENHCNGNSKTFNPLYNELFDVIGMKKDERGFYRGNIAEIDIRHRNNESFLREMEAIIPLIEVLP